MNPFFQKSKKLARLKANRKQLPKASRAFFITLMVAVALQFQGQIFAESQTLQSDAFGHVEAAY